MIYSATIIHAYFFKQAGGRNFLSGTELCKHVSEASRSVRDSVASLEISSFPLMRDGLEEYSLYVTDSNLPHSRITLTFLIPYQYTGERISYSQFGTNGLRLT